MPYRFFYIGPRKIILLLQDAFRRAKEAKLTTEQIASYDIVPTIEEQSRLNKTKFERLVSELWRERVAAVVFYDNGYDPSQLRSLKDRIQASGVTIYPLKRPKETREDCDRAAMMMMSTPLWTRAYVGEVIAPDEALLEELCRAEAQRDDFSSRLQSLTTPTDTLQTIAEVVAEFKKQNKYVVITEVTEETAKTCLYDDSIVASKALAAISDYVQALQKPNGEEIDLANHFNTAGFQFAPTNTAITKNTKSEHYRVGVDGKIYNTHMHLKRGQFRIYFHLRGADKAIIGAIGDHLPTAAYDG